MHLTGIHHLTAVTAQVSENHAFYTRTLGMRLVKKTVNQDDVSAYHLFYADALGSPGTDLTFFDWPVGPEQRGTGSVVRTGLRVAGEDALRWWRQRFGEAGVKHDEVVERNGRKALDFEDSEGQRLSLVDDGGAGLAHPWDKSPAPPEHQIRGLGPITLSVPDSALTERLLTAVMGLRRERDFSDNGRTVQVYAMGDGGPGAELHLRVEPDLPRARAGAGGVHHVAFRTPTNETFRDCAEHLRTSRVPSSGPIDRFYFKSLYFREPNGVLFEIATDGPGFSADEPVETLGERLSLPPFLEARRADIEAGLRAL